MFCFYYDQLNFKTQLKFSILSLQLWIQRQVGVWKMLRTFRKILKSDHILKPHSKLSVLHIDLQYSKLHFCNWKGWIFSNTVACASENRDSDLFQGYHFCPMLHYRTLRLMALQFFWTGFRSYKMTIDPDTNNVTNLINTGNFTNEIAVYKLIVNVMWKKNSNMKLHFHYRLLLGKFMQTLFSPVYFHHSWKFGALDWRLLCLKSLCLP